MKKLIAILALTMMVGVQTMGHAFADGGGNAVQALTLPFRLVTAAGGGALGLVAGGVQGIIETEQTFAEKTFGQADDNLMMVPVGIVGAGVAVPVGFIMGAPKGARDWGAKGYNMWDDL